MAAAVLEASSPQALESFDSKMRDFRLAIEYKYLIKHAPGGVYMLPELDNIRKLHGVVFVRRGLWRNGVFRFLVVLPDNYNTTGSFPHVFFTPPIYNPLVHPETGKLDITLDDSLLQEWHQDKHFLHTIAMAVKKIFYVKSYAAIPSGEQGGGGAGLGLANPQARAALEEDKPSFLAKVEACVNESLALVRRFEEGASGGGGGGGEANDDEYGGSAAAAAAAAGLGPKCTLVFTEPRPAHEVLLRQILEREREAEEAAAAAGAAAGAAGAAGGWTAGAVGAAAGAAGPASPGGAKYYDETEALEDRDSAARLEDED